MGAATLSTTTAGTKLVLGEPYTNNSHHMSSSLCISSSYYNLSSSLPAISNTTQFFTLSKSQWLPHSARTTHTSKRIRPPRRRKFQLSGRVFSSLIDPLTSSSFFDLADSATASSYSSASYYTSLGLFVISVPGLWSLIKRSVKSKIVKKTYIAEDGEGNKSPSQVAGEILSFFTRNNFDVLERGETITFEGTMVPSRGQAALLTFCTCISLASVSLVLTITNPDFGNNWFWLTIFSPLAGVYYWKRASRKEQIKVKMIVADGGTLTEIIVQGDDVQVEQMRKELQLNEKGMVYVKGIFERS